MAQFARTQGFERPYLLADTSIEYSETFCELFETAWTTLGGSIAGQQTFLNSDPSIANQVSAVRDVRRRRGDHVLVPAGRGQRGPPGAHGRRRPADHRRRRLRRHVLARGDPRPVGLLLPGDGLVGGRRSQPRRSTSSSPRSIPPAVRSTRCSATRSSRAASWRWRGTAATRRARRWRRRSRVSPMSRCSSGRPPTPPSATCRSGGRWRWWRSRMARRRSSSTPRPRSFPTRPAEPDTASGATVTVTTVPLRLEALGVSVHFTGIKAVEGVDLHLEEGEILGLIGPNGAGKTTLVNALSGFQRPSAGSIWIGGIETTEWKPDRCTRHDVSSRRRGRQRSDRQRVVQPDRRRLRWGGGHAPPARAVRSPRRASCRTTTRRCSARSPPSTASAVPRG